MTILALCNVGLRDLQLNEQKVEPARLRGQELWERYDEQVATALSFPILEPSVHYILGQHDQGIDRLVLFGTDQPPDDPTQHARDTLYFAKLVAKRLPDLFAEKLDQVEATTIEQINPALYDEMFETFDGRLCGLCHDEVEFCYVIVWAGSEQGMS